MLGKKKSISDEQWLHAWEHCTEIISKEHILKLEERAIQAVVRLKSEYGKIAYGWTGGKDSIVIQGIIERSGFNIQPIQWITPLQFPVINEWTAKHKPQNLITITMGYGDYEWLEKHPKCLFTQGDTITAWMSRKWKAQQEYLNREKYDCFITGRRLLDSNNCGSKADGYIKKGRSFDTANIIADWRHEEVFAYIKYMGYELPPCYFWNRGFKIGSGAWAERDAYERSETEMWEETFSIDPSVVYEAAKHLTSARKFLEQKRK